MPVIVAPQDYAAWLDNDAPDLMRYVRPFPAERIRARPVGLRVNQPENDDPSLLEESRGPLQHGLL